MDNLKNIHGSLRNVTKETPSDVINWFLSRYRSHVCLTDKEEKEIFIAVDKDGHLFRYDCIEDLSSIKTAAFSPFVKKIAPGTFDGFTSLEIVSWDKEKTQVSEESFTGCPFNLAE